MEYNYDQIDSDSGPLVTPRVIERKCAHEVVDCENTHWPDIASRGEISGDKTNFVAASAQ